MPPGGRDWWLPHDSGAGLCWQHVGGVGSTTTTTTTKVMVGEIEQVTVKPSSKKDSCGVCGRKTMLNAVLCKSCGNWLHGRCAMIKWVTNRLAMDFECRKCKVYHKNVEDQKEKLHDDVKTVTEFSYLGDRINSCNM